MLKKLFTFLCSYFLTIVVLFFLFLLTLFGTLEQVHMGLWEVQQKYFSSFFLVHRFLGSIPILLPGGYLLSIILFINLLCGALVRTRKDWRRPGLLIAHFGILVMLAGGAVTYHYAQNGHMTLFENETANTFQSYHDWEIVVSGLENGKAVREYVIDGTTFPKIKAGTSKRFDRADLPFHLIVDQVKKNCVPEMGSSNPGAIDGFALKELDLEPKSESNVMGVRVTAVNKADQTEQAGLLWGRSMRPWVISADGKDFAVGLRHRTWEVPFTILLDKFSHDYHPGTSMASNYSSDVTMVEGTSSRPIHIKMNEPLRHKGYTLFQASFGEAKDGSMYSTFAVVKNPSDQWPKYSCYIMTIGMALHFIQRLLEYLQRQQRRRA
jgi:hypothetical protein